jgi:hypothetical protein
MSRTDAMRRAVRRNEWELISLYLALAVVRLAQATPRSTIDDVLALLRAEEDPDVPRGD